MEIIHECTDCTARLASIIIAQRIPKPILETAVTGQRTPMCRCAVSCKQTLKFVSLHTTHTAMTGCRAEATNKASPSCIRCSDQRKAPGGPEPFTFHPPLASETATFTGKLKTSGTQLTPAPCDPCEALKPPGPHRLPKAQIERRDRRNEEAMMLMVLALPPQACKSDPVKIPTRCEPVVVKRFETRNQEGALLMMLALHQLDQSAHAILARVRSW